MARIRTIKPEFWSDGALIECSLNARLLFIGTWNFADDYGNIERSSKQMKARIFPADNVDCEPLLLELIGQGMLVEYASEGRRYLHIRGFTKHQVINRPGKPQCPPFVGSVKPPTSFTDHSVNDHGGKEGKGKEGKELPKLAAQPVDAHDLVDAALRKVPGVEGHPIFADANIGPIWQLVQQGIDFKTIIVPSIKSQVAKRLSSRLPIKNWSYFVPGILESIQGPSIAAKQLSDEAWAKRLSTARRLRQWDSKWCPMPGRPGCAVPPALLQPGDGDGWTEWKSEAA